MLEQLERLARCRAPQQRAELLATVIDLYRAAGGRCDDSIGAAFCDIVLRVLPELPGAEQQSLGARLAGLPNLPKGLALALAGGGGSVAGEILRHSPVLAEEDLLHLAGRLAEGELLAIAARTRLSERVTDALVGRGGQALLRAIGANRSARLSAASLAHILAACGLTDPADLRAPADILSLPATGRSRRTKRGMAESKSADGRGIVIAWPRKAAAPRALTGESAPLAETSAVRSRGDSLLDVATLLAGQVGLPADLVIRLIGRPDPALLVVLCRAAGVSPALFSLFARIRARRLGLPSRQARAVEAAYAALSESEARRAALRS